MSATATASGVLLSWSTATEVDTVGFRLLRESRQKAMTVIASMIPASGGDLLGASYQFLDNDRKANAGAQYYIEDIDIFGKVTRHGPILVVRGKPRTTAR